MAVNNFTIKILVGSDNELLLKKRNYFWQNSESYEFMRQCAFMYSKT